jgi:stage V sporulation protein SpoVS
MIELQVVRPPPIRTETITFKITEQDKKLLQELGSGCITYGVKTLVETFRYMRANNLVKIPEFDDSGFIKRKYKTGRPKKNPITVTKNDVGETPQPEAVDQTI